MERSKKREKNKDVGKRQKDREEERKRAKERREREKDVKRESCLQSRKIENEANFRINNSSNHNSFQSSPDL